MNKIMLPVVIEQMIEKLTDSKVHPEMRQHYANTIKNIIDASTSALHKWEADYALKKKVK